MSNYRNIEINLLPPELLPPPMVRAAVILNAAVILGVLAYIALSSLSIFAQVRTQQEEIKVAEQEIKNREHIEETFTRLSNVKEQVDKYGRLVSLASVDYVDVPVLLDRLARVIPAGVYLESVSNDKPAAGAKSTIVQIVLVTTKHDTGLVQATLDALKEDSIFGDCFLRGAEIRRESISTQLEGYDVDWSASGPEVSATLDVEKYQFTIMANVPKLLDTANLPVVADKSIYLADVKFRSPPAEDADDEKGGAGARKSSKAGPDREAANAPEGVKPVEVN